jgi:G3E family GTPase
MCTILDSSQQHLEDSKPEGAINEALQQIAFSDLILLNKIDLVKEEEKMKVLRAVRKINFTARLLECQLNDPAGRPSIDQLLGINSFSINKALEVKKLFLQLLN